MDTIAGKGKSSSSYIDAESPAIIPMMMPPVLAINDGPINYLEGLKIIYIMKLRRRHHTDSSTKHVYMLTMKIRDIVII